MDGYNRHLDTSPEQTSVNWMKPGRSFQL